MPSASSTPPDPALIKALRSRANGGTDVISLEDYIDCVLYHPACGYYTAEHKRIGRTPRTDFYTATSLGPLFAELVVSAIGSLASRTLDTFIFVEFGPESETGLVGALEASPFKETVLLRPGDPLEIPPEAIVFSNELFDAQPFRRFQRARGTWLEAGVRIGDTRLEPVLCEPFHGLPGLPQEAPEGYLIDWPSGAHRLMGNICAPTWNGLFIAFDYGLEQTTIFQHRPRGTARTYSGHRMGADLLENPGKQDITCHLVWEELEAILARNQFYETTLQRQEAFFMHHAGEVIRRLIETAPVGFSRRKQTLMELMHPDNMGHKFQVLHARRGKV